jgi:hypothetical protein
MQHERSQEGRHVYICGRHYGSYGLFSYGCGLANVAAQCDGVMICNDEIVWAYELDFVH